MCKRGFTLIELLLVIVLLSIVGIIVFPIGARFYQVQVVADTVSELVDTLRTAQNFSITQKHDSSHGVKVVDNSLVLFQGLSYDTRATQEDVTVAFPAIVSLSGLDEVVFTQESGIPDAAHVIDITVQDHSEQITITTAGTIEP